MNTKRCGGYKGNWECIDEYPDHMVPISEFNKDRKAKDGAQRRCKICDKNLYRKVQSMIMHPITGKVKRNWKETYARSIGGTQGTPEWQSCLDKAEEQWEIEYYWYGIPSYRKEQRTKRKLPKVDRPKSKRVTTIQVDDPRGFVYIFKDHMKREGLYKIGASHEPQERLDQANTWGDFESIYESEEVADCTKLEKEVHQSLREHQLKGEWFNITEDLAINTIKELVNESFDYAVAS